MRRSRSRSPPPPASATPAERRQWRTSAGGDGSRSDCGSGHVSPRARRSHCDGSAEEVPPAGVEGGGDARKGGPGASRQDGREWAFDAELHQKLRKVPRRGRGGVGTRVFDTGAPIHLAESPPSMAFVYCLCTWMDASVDASVRVMACGGMR